MRLRFALATCLAVLLLQCAPLSRSQTPESKDTGLEPEVTIPTGWVYTVAGNGSYNYCGDGSKATVACLRSPDDMAVDSAGNLYIADSGNCVIRKVDAVSKVISTYAGTPVSCGYSGDGGLATAAQLHSPQSVTFDAAGNLYIADNGNNVVRKVDTKTLDISTFAGTGMAGYNGDGGAALKAELNGPDGLVFDGAGNLYIGDYNNNVVRIVDTTNTMNTFAGTGTAAYSGDGGPATFANLNGPGRLAFDKARGNLFIADFTNSAVRKVDSTGTITTVAGTGVYSYSYPGDGMLANTVELRRPTGPAVDSAGNLFFADGAMHLVFEVAASTGKMKIIGGTAFSAGYSGDGGPATSAQFNVPTAVTLDGAGNLYVSDQNNQRVREIYGVTPVTSATTAPPTFSPAGGTYTAPQTVTLQDATTGAVIYYTINGTAPTKSSTVYKTPIAVDATTTIKAIAIAGTSTSTVASATYTINMPVTATPTFTPKAGTYAVAQTVTIVDATAAASIYYTTDGSAPTTGSTKYTAPILVGVTETIKAIAIATGDKQSAVASALYTITVAAKAAAPAFSPAAGTYVKTVTVTLTDATKGAVIYYTLNGTTPTATSTKYSAPIVVTKTTTIEAIAIATGYANSIVSSATYTIDAGVTVAPVFSPKAGIFGSVQDVTLTDAAADAVIYYTLDGTTPTTKSSVYSTPLMVSTPDVIKAIAIAPTDEMSTVTMADYIIAGTPTVLTAPATVITTTGATLNALADTLGVAGTYSFQYGTTATALTTVTKPVVLTASVARASVTLALTTLKTKTKYYYRAVVVTVGGTATSEVVSFTTD